MILREVEKHLDGCPSMAGPSIVIQALPGKLPPALPAIVHKAWQLMSLAC